MKISTKPKLVTRKVTIQEPQDGTGYTERKVVVTFEWRNEDEVKALAEQDGAPILAEVIKGWGDEKGRGGFKDEHDQPLEFNEDNVKALLSVGYVARALTQHYFDMIRGGKLGN